MAVLRFNVTFYDDVIGTGNGQNRYQRPRISRKTYIKLVFQKFHYGQAILKTLFSPKIALKHYFRPK